jgi:hypothetical protein
MVETSNPALHPTTSQGRYEQPALMDVQGRWLAGDIVQLQLTVSTLEGGHVPMGIRKFTVPIEEDASVVQVAEQIAASLSRDDLLDSGFRDNEIAVRPVDHHHQLTLQPTIVFKPEGAQPRKPAPEDEYPAELSEDPE